MKKLILPLLFLALAANAPQASAAPITTESDPALVGSTLQDFESGPTGTWTSKDFGGLTITAGSTGDIANPVFSVGNDYSGDFNTRGLYHVTNYGAEFDRLEFDFNAPVSAFGFLFGASDANWKLDAYNSGGLLESLTIAPTRWSNAGDFFGLGDLAGATSATLTQNKDLTYAGGGVDYVFVDNVRFTATTLPDPGPAPVPEPSTFLLLGAGLVGVGFLRKKTKA